MTDIPGWIYIRPDEGGWEALDLGSYYYRKGMDLQSPEEHEERIENFRAARAMYSLAASRGNIQAYCNLGYVYAYDRCEGHYLAGDDELASTDDVELALKRRDAFDPDERAYECFKVAAEAGSAEGCYKLGDMLQAGRGCNADVEEAYEWYKRAYELDGGHEPATWGSAALRLAECCQEGRGCAQDFAEAMRWYEIAETGLRLAVDDGDWYYQKQLARASEGLQFMKQELSGEY